MIRIKIGILLFLTSFSLFSGVEEDFMGMLASREFKTISPEISRQIHTHFIKAPGNPHIIFLGRSLVFESMILEAIDPLKSSSVPGSNLTNKPPKNISSPTGFNGSTYKEHLDYWLPSLEELKARGQKSIIVSDYADSGKSIKNFAKLVNEYYEGKIEIKIKVFMGERSSGERLLFKKSEKISMSMARENAIGRQKFDSFSKYKKFIWGEDNPLELMPKEQLDSYVKNRNLLKRIYLKDDPILSGYLRTFKKIDASSACLWKTLSKIPFY